MELSNQGSTPHYFNLPNPGLRAYFNLVASGNPDDYRPPFWKGRTREEVLAAWQDKVDALKLQREYPTLYNFEMEMKSKVGPMSIMAPLKDRLSGIEEYYTAAAKGGEPVDQRAVDAVLGEFAGIKGMRLRPTVSTLEKMRLSTNSGAPYFQKRRTVLSKSMPYKVTSTQQIIRGNKYDLTAILGWRGQEGGPNKADVKQRTVWMFPLCVNIEELRFYQVLIELCQARNLIRPWISMEAVDFGITKLFDTKNRDDLVVCTDFSAFDQHFGEPLQNCAQSIIKRLLTPSDESEEWLAQIFPIKYQIPLALSLDRIKHGPHGMASGSGGTNADETLVHRALQYECSLLNGSTLNQWSSCLGDDGIISFRGCTPDVVMQAYMRHGLSMNADKQYASTHDCVFLRRWHSQSYRDSAGIMVGVYSTFRALGRLLAQERYYDPDEWGPEMVTLRALSIIENCNKHPHFEQFVDFCMEGDAFRLGLRIPGFLANIGGIAKKAIDHIPDFLGYTKTMQSAAQGSVAGGIESWRVIKYLKSKA